jgi:cytoskeletal protein CcmA (bactofilin family)
LKVKRDNVSIIQKDCSVEGKLNYSGYLIVAGDIQGILHAETVVTREGSRIAGELKIQSLTVAGTVEGDIVADRLMLLKTADVKGKIRCSSLVIEEGGLLNGNVKWKTSSESGIQKYSSEFSAQDSELEKI